MVKSDKIRQIRKLLTEGFSAQELHRICYDYPDFRDVCNQLENRSLDDVVQKIIEFAVRRHLIDDLLEVIQKENPTIYLSLGTLSEESTNPSSKEYRQKLSEIVALLSEKLKELQRLKAIPSDIEFGNQIASQEQEVRKLHEKLRKELTKPITHSSLDDTAYSANRLAHIKSLEEKISQLHDEQEGLKKALQFSPGGFSQVSRRTGLLFSAIFLVVIISIGAATFFVLNSRIPFDGFAPGANTEVTFTASVPTVEVSSTPTTKFTSTPTLIPLFTPTKETLPTVTNVPTVLPTEEPSSTPEPFTAIPTAIPTPTSAPTVQPTATEIPLLSTATPISWLVGIFEDFENENSCLWKLGKQPYGNSSCSTDKIYGGQSAGKLTYNFPAVADNFVVFQKSYPLAGKPNTISAAVYGDNSGYLLNVWIKDADGEIWQIPLGPIQGNDWQKMVGEIKAAGPWPYDLINGNNNGKIDYPISFNAIVLDGIPDNSAGQGTIYIDDLDSSDTPLVAASPTFTSTPTRSPSHLGPLTGRIAFPMDDGSGNYNVWVRNLSTGEDTLAVSRARQPNFYKQDGRLLVNGENNDKGNNIILVDSNFNFVDMISEFPEDEHPFWDTGGSRLVHGNPVAIGGLPHLFVHCSLKRPQFEDDPQCQDVITYGVLGVSGPGDMWGGSPVWLPDNRIAFQGLGDMAPYNGIYLIDSSAALKYRGQKYNLPERPLLIPQTTSNSRPTDAWNDRLFFFADDIDGNWEVYSIKLDGSDRINLSNSPNSSEGLPTVSPDGQWVAFVSHQSKSWEIWVVPIAGGTPEKLFDFPRANPWGVGPHDWTTERISWGP